MGKFYFIWSQTDYQLTDYFEPEHIICVTNSKKYALKKIDDLIFKYKSGSEVPIAFETNLDAPITTEIEKPILKVYIGVSPDGMDWDKEVRFWITGGHIGQFIGEDNLF